MPLSIRLASSRQRVFQSSQSALHRRKSLVAMAPGIVDDRSENMPNVLNKSLRHEEYQYLDLIRDILQNGEHRPDRYRLCLIACISNSPTESIHLELAPVHTRYSPPRNP